MMSRKLWYDLLILVQVLGVAYQGFLLNPVRFGNRISTSLGFGKCFLCSISSLWLALASTDSLSLFNHRCPTGDMLLEETTRCTSGR